MTVNNMCERRLLCAYLANYRACSYFPDLKMLRKHEIAYAKIMLIQTLTHTNIYVWDKKNSKCQVSDKIRKFVKDIRKDKAKHCQADYQGQHTCGRK